MVWWLHLVIRKADTLKSRCKVFERVVRAVGSYSYAERSAPLLLHLSLISRCGYISYKTVNTVSHRGYDLPAQIGASFSQWLRWGERFRAGNASHVSFGYLDPMVHVLFYWDSGKSVQFSCLPENGHFNNKMWEEAMKPRQDHVSGKTP